MKYVMLSMYYTRTVEAGEMYTQDLEIQQNIQYTSSLTIKKTDKYLRKNLEQTKINISANKMVPIPTATKFHSLSTQINNPTLKRQTSW